MKLKYLVSCLTILAGLSISAQQAAADVVVEWQAGDNSANIQQAINSGDSLVIISQAPQPWIIGNPLFAKQPNQTILFEPGVTLLAQEGAFQHILDSLITISADNVTLSGYSATLQMRKDDYDNPDLYEPSHFRHLIRIRGALGFTVEGLTLKDSGGDGILVAHGPRNGNEIPERIFSSGTIRDVVADGNYRLGIGIVSAKDLLVENSTFKNTSGVRPASGVDFEPDHDWQKLVNIEFNNTDFTNNVRNGVQLGLGGYRGSLVEDVSISFNNCTAIGNGEIGIKIQGVRAGLYNGAKGSLDFDGFKIENSGRDGIWIRNDQIDPTQTYEITFNNTKVINSATKPGEYHPVTLWNNVAPGGITNVDFGDDFTIVDNKKRPGLYANEDAIKDGFTNVSGIVHIDNPKQKPPRLGRKMTNVDLKFTK